MRDLVMEVAPLIGDMRMHSRQVLTGLLATLPPRQVALNEPKAAFSRAEVTRICNLRPVA